MLKLKIFLSLAIVLGFWGFNFFLDSILFPEASMSVGVSQLEDSNEEFENRQYVEKAKSVTEYVTIFVMGVFLFVLWEKNLWKILKRKGEKEDMEKKYDSKVIGLILLLFGLTIIFSGCRRPVDVPEFEEIRNNETAFVIPLEGKTSDQQKFASVNYLETLQVATKRIQIPHRWIAEGRKWQVAKGRYIDTVKVIKVDRTPVTREWTADSKTGTSQNDQAIWVESQDSVGFAIGFSVTAQINEANAALFLYTYPSGSLDRVMDTEMRTRVQSKAAEICSKYDLDELRSKKSEILDAVRRDVNDFYQSRGVNVTTVGMLGGFTYENPEVQNAIDDVFKAQQQEDVEEAKRKAALKQKESIMILADAEAQRIQKIADAEAQKIEKINQAAEKAQQNPLFLQLRQLEVEQERIEKWNGEYPKWYMGDGMSGTNPSLLLNVNPEE